MNDNNIMPNIQHILNLQGFVRTLDFAPTAVPKGFSDQFVIVTSGGSSRAYIYDTKPTGGNAWRFVALT